jgi:hypothetical protein
LNDVMGRLRGNVRSAVGRARGTSETSECASSSGDTGLPCQSRRPGGRRAPSGPMRGDSGSAPPGSWVVVEVGDMITDTLRRRVSKPRERVRRGRGAIYSTGWSCWNPIGTGVKTGEVRLSRVASGSGVLERVKVVISVAVEARRTGRWGLGVEGAVAVGGALAGPSQTVVVVGIEIERSMSNRDRREAFF